MNKNNTKVTIKSLGTIELKYISAGDTVEYSNILSKKDNHRELTEKILFNQLLSPKLSFKEFKELPPKDIEKIAKAFIKNESHTFKDYKSTGDVYKDFTKALRTYERKELELINKSIQPMLDAAQAVLKDFNKTYGSIISQSLTGASTIGTAINEIAKINKTVSDDLLGNAALMVKSAVEQYSSVADSISSLLIPQIDYWQDWVNQNKAIFDNATKIWADYHKQYSVAEKKAAAVLRKYKWFVSPSIPVTLIFEIQKLDKKPGRHDKTINEFFIGFFEANSWQNLDNMVNRWSANSLFKKRYKIIADCVRTIKRSSRKDANISNVVLPTLIIQIDGILNDYMASKGLTARGYNDRNVVMRTNIPTIMTADLSNLANDIFLNILFQQSFPGTPLATPFNFNRHKILHAENVNYGRKDYLIRAFMVLDLLGSLS